MIFAATKRFGVNKNVSSRAIITYSNDLYFFVPQTAFDLPFIFFFSSSPLDGLLGGRKLIFSSPCASGAVSRCTCIAVGSGVGGNGAPGTHGGVGPWCSGSESGRSPLFGHPPKAIEN